MPLIVNTNTSEIYMGKHVEITPNLHRWKLMDINNSRDTICLVVASAFNKDFVDVLCIPTSQILNKCGTVRGEDTVYFLEKLFISFNPVGFVASESESSESESNKNDSNNNESSDENEDIAEKKKDGVFSFFDLL